uniref:Plant heme peroxidase family profile domain-containing protein n=1 Tax=Picea sitchensis TaxID=3332 RepID=B8LPL8_PICSI|nr:unknown [Picea sitchensis]
MALALGFAAASSLFLPHNFTRFPKISTSSSSRGRCRVRHVSTVICFASDPQQLKQARQDLNDLIKTTRCNPLLIRVGWHDAGTYDTGIRVRVFFQWWSITGIRSSGKDLVFEVGVVSAKYPSSNFDESPDCEGSNHLSS